MAQSGTELFSTSWTLHRLSPLYHGQDSNSSLLGAPECFRVYASRLRDTLTGNVLGGIVQTSIPSTSIGGLDDVLARAGALKECKWTNIPTWSYWNEEHSILEDTDQEASLTLTPDQSAGILISLHYENATYKAALLAGPDGYHSEADGTEGTTFLPLLVTRMPNALRQSLISFLSETFDTRVSVLRLPSSFLCRALERYLATLNRTATRARRHTANQTTASSVESRAFIESVIKEVQLTLSFPPPVSTDLKSLDVHLPRESLSAFYEHGLGKPEAENGKRSKEADTPSTPFLNALSEYFDRNLAMKLDLRDFMGQPTSSKGDSRRTNIKLTRVSCGAFVLGSEGRIKFLANPGRTILLDDSDEEEGDGIDVDEREKRLVWKANEELLRVLIVRATGLGMVDNDS
ncbi:hypothetical protein MGYG_00688 [Nannizzia gypsea CBS 118893]|uniref:Uncharacterized protein n=1 Tax=Arthroderma gypseum (strain ATCC MYA-4604 / CBS 118893) TaxID=535722 RepID=E5R146_ARTGP|nr:hypothetical protein MGYG_00688 [Nannizzia gypsea CBS 118893]EFQ97650.1 hypothetical protein MGYG_00688 [Nannizzia gypsea CBS 118893]